MLSAAAVSADLLTPQLDHEALQTLASKCQLPFTLAACSTPLGENAFFAKSCQDQTFLDIDCSGEHVWLNPHTQLHLTICSIMLNAKQSRLMQPSACILVPSCRQPESWRPLLNRMRLLTVYQPGCAPSSNAKFLEKDRSWSLYFDPPVPKLTLNVAVREFLTMQISGVVAGASASFLVDSGASHCFVSAAYCSQAGLRYTPPTGELHVANGATVPILGSLRVQVKVQQYTEQLTLYVTELAERFDVILGENWMLSHSTDLLYSQRRLRFTHNRKSFVWLCAHTEPANTNAIPCLNSMLLNAAQFRYI